MLVARVPMVPVAWTSATPPSPSRRPSPPLLNPWNRTLYVVGPGATTHAWALKLPLAPPLGQRLTILIVSFRRLHLASPREAHEDGDGAASDRRVHASQT